MAAPSPPLSPKERMARALHRQPVDRLPVQSNYTPAMGQRLAEFFGVSPAELPARLDNHFLRLDPSFPRRASADGKIAYDLWGAGWDTETEGYWLAHAPLAASKDLDAFPWPNPEAPGLLDGPRQALAADAGRHFAAPNFGLCLFERAWSLRAFDTLLMDTVEDPAWVAELLDRITDIQVSLARRFVGLGVDGGYLGDDYGAQKGMLFSPRMWRTLIKPRLARLVAVFKDAGLPVILHSDGDIWAVLPDLVEVGVDCLNPVQPEVLEHARLAREYGDRLAFYGGISTQTVMSVADPEAVRAATRATAAALAPHGTGLVLGPSHRMQSDIPPGNVAAMLDAFPREGP